MKLSVSAYRAHASAHKKILDTAYQLNYGSTSASHHPTTSATVTPFQIDPPDENEPQPQQNVGMTGTAAAAAAATTTTVAGAKGSAAGDVGDGAGSSDDANTPLQSPKSQNTSHEDEEEEEEEDESSNANESDCKSPTNQRCVEDNDDDDDDEDKGGEETAKAATQSWKNLRAVMAYYHSLRKIKRTKSNQRWMKLRTTVQISSAMQKKPPLKREDSFLQRFSTRQIPETQETVEDTGSEGGTGTDGTTTSRRRRRVRKQPRSVVNPDENFYFHWLLVLTCSVLYNLWSLIVRQSFPEFQALLSRFWFACDSLSDVFFLLDVVVQLRTGYLEQGLMVYDSKKLAKHYLTSRAFLLDLAALCPLDLLQIRLGPQPLLRFPRFLKVYRAVNYYYMVESRTVYPNLWRVVNLIHILLILAHWFGCFYFLLSEAEGFQGDWVYPYRPGDYATLTRKYLGSLYWSTLTLTTIGDLPTPETNAEKTDSVDGPRSLPRRGVKSRLLQFNNNGGYVFTIVSYLIGVFIFATIVGQVGNVITNRNANRLEFERLLDGAKTYMRHHKVPGGMKRRVLRWYDYSWSRGRIQGGGDINTALGLLPDKLKTELALHVNLSVLKKVTIFQECQPEFLRDLVLKMKAYIFTPGDSICRKGEVAREMFIIADGILEVLSEAGRVLTTMKAGDFFGEIGILNLDGLNKRTADVRSVGYSELFSLSREDVLNAMKDYPEAQEILQALGRKRLMEVKASARQYHKEQKEQAAHSADGKGLVDKIKNEAKGLRNALRKTRTHRRSQESLELQPLHSKESNGAKGVLRRMPRVRSHDLSQDEEKKEAGDLPDGEKVISPLGAGLPLLARLRLLKEKQEREERERQIATCATPSILSPSPSSVKSPPPVPEEQHPQEVIGAGLPLLQRLLLLKAKEDKTSGPSQPTSPTALNFAPSIQSKQRASISAPSSTSAAGATAGGGTGQSIPPPPKSLLTVSASKPATGKISFKDRLKLLKEPKEVVIVVKPEPSSTSAAEVQSDSNSSEAPWSKLKKAAIVREFEPSTSTPPQLPPPPPPPPPPPSTSSTSQTPKVTEVVGVEAKPSAVLINKPSLVLTRRTKHYRSIDDLSPEYGGLPFVKKLKILNERQKLEELETVMKTRSFSLDIPDSQAIDGTENLTRSHSEGSTMHQKDLLTTQLLPSPLHSSTESNETLERRNLKSILKKLSEETNQQQHQQQQPQQQQQLQAAAATMPDKIDSTEFRKLMRAPTIEGYAARHSKLSKSVTFNRDTLQSPPNSANIVGAADALFPFSGNSPTGNGIDRSGEEGNHQELEKCGIQIISPKTNQIKYGKGSLDDEQQYFADILFAIKQVMSNHLVDMQDKYEQRIQRMQEEIRAKDETIEQLRAHIVELEMAADDSFTDSIETVVSGRDRSWDDLNRHESTEVEQLPQTPLMPQSVWSSPTHRRHSQQQLHLQQHHHQQQQQQQRRVDESCVLDIDSNTDTESELGDSSEPGYESGEYENTSSNWEIEMLAAQMRHHRRSASLDHASSRPVRRRFTRGSSADTRRD